MKGRFENKPTEAWNNMKREGMTNRQGDFLYRRCTALYALKKEKTGTT